MHNTPVYVYDEPASSMLNRIYIIDHGTVNTGTRVTGVQAAGLVMANCVQQNWSHEMIGGLLESVMQLVTQVPVTRLSFLPDKSIIEYILSDEGQDQTAKRSS
jgi:hypothetical protein